MKNFLIFLSVLAFSFPLFGQDGNNEKEKWYYEAEINPVFHGCEDIGNKDEIKDCTQKKILQFIYSNLKYPQEAKRKEIEGRVVIEFIIEKDGSVSNVKVLRGIGGGCDEAAIEVIKSIPNWKPGIRKDAPVRIKVRFPIDFRDQMPTFN